MLEKWSEAFTFVFILAVFFVLYFFVIAPAYMLAKIINHPFVVMILLFAIFGGKLAAMMWLGEI